jgi:bifunctional DNA-binding transcriptional regulator/antitoxin component of YhaV-PrlF toxin-antitoxin module
MRFRTVILQNGKTATGIEVPTDVVAALGPSKKPKVTVTIREYTYPSSVASMGGRFMIPVSAEVREKAGVAAGDEVDVEVAIDDAPREVSVPPDLAAALDANRAARHTFDHLSYSHQRRYVLAVEAAKTAETRQRRIDKSVSDLEAGPPKR